ncbi:unnamed protein product [Ceratitis capitata]|uniref:(Mediterranean fruit fly) hypothetical protein n=1 Tax=Ceratitis capitata TaxID=7213 RepID=A0A811VC93_CERCA|nr:unnamed protein product [Ceratitis capitata]
MAFTQHSCLWPLMYNYQQLHVVFTRRRPQRCLPPDRQRTTPPPPPPPQGCNASSVRQIGSRTLSYNWWQQLDDGGNVFVRLAATRPTIQPVYPRSCTPNVQMPMVV